MKNADENKLTITPLGAGLEVGRSCIVLSYKGKNIMFDCGVHMKFTGQESLPFFDQIDTSKIDLLLVTHFHLDHCGAVPFFLEKTHFKGRCYMTYPTKAIYKLVIADSAKVSNPRGDNASLFDKNDLNNSMSKIHMIDYHQEMEYKGIKFTCYNAGHVLGAAMFLVEIDGVRVLYTGDYSREEDRHLNPAEIPDCTVDVLIVESTYGVKDHEPRHKREFRFSKEVHDIVKRGGKCLLPVFALGRAQELLLILEEYWQSHEELKGVPIYYPCALAAKSMIIFQTYFNMMGANVQEKFKNGINPFNFKFIETLKNLDSWNENEPCVIMTSPGMLQNGYSREIFEKWCHDERNGIVLTGYCVKGTLAEQIMSHPDKIEKMDKCHVDLKMSISSISFSAHADFGQTSDFIGKLKPKNVILVHGEKNECNRLHAELQKTFPTIRIFKPANQKSEEFSFESRKTCKILGELATEIKEEILKQEEKLIAPKNEEMEIEGNDHQKMILNTSVKISDGVLLQDENNLIILKEKDLAKFTSYLPKEINQKLYIPFAATLNLVRSFATQLLGDRDKVQVVVKKNNRKYIQINEDFFISKYEHKSMVTFEWVSSKKNDIAADHLAFLLSQFPDDPEFDLFFDDNKPNTHQSIKNLLKANFPGIEFDESKNLVVIMNGLSNAVVNLNNYNVDCTNEELKERIGILIDMVVQQALH